MPVKKTVRSFKNAVKRNQTLINTTAIVALSAVVVVMKFGLNQHDEFLKEHDLYDEFYQPED